MRNKESLQKYLEKTREAVKYPGARQLYFPSGEAERRKGNLRFARELGYGLADFDKKDVSDILGSLYSIFIVSNSLDNTGVQIDAKEFIHHLNLDRQPAGEPPVGGS